MKKLVGDIDDMLQWTNDLRTELKSGTPFGALPDTAKEQFEKFQVRGVNPNKRNKFSNSFQLDVHFQFFHFDFLAKEFVLLIRPDFFDFLFYRPSRPNFWEIEKKIKEFFFSILFF